jgi:hypothetical protein
MTEMIATITIENFMGDQAMLSAHVAFNWSIQMHSLHSHHSHHRRSIDIVNHWGSVHG